MPYSNDEPPNIFGAPNDDYSVNKSPDLYDFPSSFRSNLSATIPQAQQYHQIGQNSSFDGAQSSAEWAHPAYPTSRFVPGGQPLPAAHYYDQGLQYPFGGSHASLYHPTPVHPSTPGFATHHHAHADYTEQWANPQALDQGSLFHIQTLYNPSAPADLNCLHLDFGPTSYNCPSLVPGVVLPMALPNPDNDRSLLPFPPSANFNDASGADQALDPLLGQDLLCFSNHEVLYSGNDAGEEVIPDIELQPPSMSPSGNESPGDPLSEGRLTSDGRVLDDTLLSPNGMSAVHQRVFVHSANPSPSLTMMSSASDYFSSSSGSPSSISGSASSSSSLVAAFCNSTPQDYVQSPAGSLLDDIRSDASSPYPRSLQRSPSQSSYYSALSHSQRDPNSCPPTFPGPNGPQQHWGPKSSIRGIVTDADFERGDSPTPFETEAYFRDRLRHTFNIDLSDDTPVDLNLIPEPARSANGTFPDNSIELMLGMAIWQLTKKGEPTRLGNIREAIQKRFPWMEKGDKMKGWQSSIRHKLSFSGLFRQPGKDHPASQGVGFPSKHGSTRGGLWFVDIRGASTRKRETPKSKSKREDKKKEFEASGSKTTKKPSRKTKKATRDAARQEESQDGMGASFSMSSPSTRVSGPTSTRRMVRVTRGQTRPRTPPVASTSTAALLPPMPPAPQPPYPLSMPAPPTHMALGQGWPELSQPGPNRHSISARMERPAPYPQRPRPRSMNDVEQFCWPFTDDFGSSGDGSDGFPG